MRIGQISKRITMLPLLPGILLLLVACSGLGSKRPDGSASGWDSYEVQAGSTALRFKLPPGASSDFPLYEVPEEIDLGGLTNPETSLTGLRVVQRAWDYRSSYFRKVDGSLRIRMHIMRSAHLISNSEELERAVENLIELRNLDTIHKGGALPPERLVRVEPCFLAMRVCALIYLRLGIPKYAVVMDDFHYLWISVEAGTFTSSEFRRAAAEAQSEFLKSIQIVVATDQ